MKKILIILGSLIVVVIVAFGAYQVHHVQVAHSTFENYYAFRGCKTLVSKTADSAVCTIANGQNIKMVLYKGGWYLDGDLPRCASNICF